MDLVLVLGSLILVATGIVEPQSKKTDELAEAPSTKVSTPELLQEPEPEPEPSQNQNQNQNQNPLRTRARARTS